MYMYKYLLDSFNQSTKINIDVHSTCITYIFCNACIIHTCNTIIITIIKLIVNRKRKKGEDKGTGDKRRKEKDDGEKDKKKKKDQKNKGSIIVVSDIQVQEDSKAIEITADEEIVLVNDDIGICMYIVHL